MSEELLYSRANVRRRLGGRRRVPIVLQMETTECGAACLAMILAHYRRWVPLEDLRVRCGISRDGSKAVNILRAARELGLVAHGFRRDPGRLFDLPFPLIVFWNFNHFVVVEGVRRNKVHIVDPAWGPRTITLEEFDEAFTGVCLAFTPGPDFRPGGRRTGVAKGLLNRLGAAHGALAVVMLATLVLIVPGLAIPTISKVFVDDVLIPRNGNLVVALLLGLGAAAILQGALTWIQQICLARMETKLSLVTSSRFFWHVVTLPMTFFDQRYAGDIASRVRSNDKVAQLISGDLAISAISTITMVVYAGVMFSYDPVLTLVSLLMVAVNVIALVCIARAREIGSHRLLKERGRVEGVAVNGIAMMETLKSTSSENEFFSRWSGMQANALIAQHDLAFLTNVIIVVPPLLASLNTIAILGVGGLRLLDGAITIGGLVAFQSLARSFASPVDGLVRFFGNLQTIKGDIARLDDVLQYQPDEPALSALHTHPPAPRRLARGAVTFENVTFGYNAKEPPLIEDFSLTIAPGERVALVGGSGSGKSTLAKLACGLLTPWSGRICIDDQDVSELPLAHLSELVAYVNQDIVLFETTVRDNVTLWNPLVDEQWITRALRDAAIQDEISSRKGRFTTEVEENGRNFSGGQRQRLEIARALCTDAPVLVLDEATAALDALTEARIDDRVRFRGCTCLVIAHRLSTIRDSDEIVVLETGTIVQRGAHDELIAREGLYRTLVSTG